MSRFLKVFILNIEDENGKKSYAISKDPYYINLDIVSGIVKAKQFKISNGNIIDFYCCRTRKGETNIVGSTLLIFCAEKQYEDIPGSIGSEIASLEGTGTEIAYPIDSNVSFKYWKCE